MYGFYLRRHTYFLKTQIHKFQIFLLQISQTSLWVIIGIYFNSSIVQHLTLFSQVEV